MPAVDLDAKMELFAKMIDGQIIRDTGRVAVCIKGTVQGMPATFEALYPKWPCGVMYTVELKQDPDAAPKRSAKITVYPRFGRGVGAFFSRVLLFESSGMSINDKRLENSLNFSYDDFKLAERFCHYPGVPDKLLSLEQQTRFSELIVKTDTGTFLSQPVSFDKLDADLFHVTFKAVGDLSAILAEGGF